MTKAVLTLAVGFAVADAGVGAGVIVNITDNSSMSIFYLTRGPTGLTFVKTW